jgi:hypothetical protein
MRTLRLAFVACAFACTAVHATDREFKEIVSAISDEFHTRPVHIPLFGLVNMVTFVARPAGTKHIDLAVFENLGNHDRSGRELAQAVRSAVGAGWKPFVQVWSHHGGQEETVLVYMRMEGHDCKLLVTSIEPNEATVVQLKLNPDTLQKWLVSPRESAFHKYRDRDEP